MAKLKKMAVNDMPEYISKYISKLNKIADVLEDIYYEGKTGNSLYQLGQKCDDELSDYYQNGASMAKNISDECHKIMDISNNLRFYCDDILHANEWRNNPEEDY